ncbi:MAG TPA: choice-of-anchor Q domain-containing protein, partial [Bacteroidia bacterium]|nr:choice-of-anchor Q domain-containing protein [Bacteroidia bacterium]
IFINNMAGLGAGFYNDGSNGGAANPRFANCTFMHNNAEIGGGLYNNGYAGDASPQLGNCTFLQNDASEGGGLYSNGEVGQSNGSYTDCIFDRNEAIRGGGIFNHADNGTTRGTFLRCDIIDNSATQFGGGLASFTQVGDAKSTFTDCNILRNHANSGGGGVWNNGASPWFYNCLLQENTAKNGAAVYNEGSQGLKTGPRLVGCTIRQNTATERGGAMFNNAIAGETESQLIYCKFISNTAIWGGAIYADGSAGGDAEDLFYNCLFSRNQASVEGGAGYGVASGGQSIQAFASCSFSANTAPTGSLFYLTQFNSGLTNFRQYNLASHGHAGTIVSLNGGAMMEVEDGIYEAGTAATCSGNCLVGQNPMFANAAADDLTLQAVSPAIDAGNNVYYLPQYPLDLGGNVRIQGGTIDMGAYETVGLPPCPRVLFVNRIATGANDGTSWADAYLDLQAALAEARVNSCIDTILIAEGTYYPTSTTNRSISYELVNDIEIYGGFPSTGNPWFPQRDIILHETILSSDIGVQGDPSDNSDVVISCGGVSPNYIPLALNSGTITDGLSVIPGGKGGIAIHTNQNGASCEAIFRDIKLYDGVCLGAYGSPLAILNLSSSSSIKPLFERCEFRDNKSWAGGGVLLKGIGGPLNQTIPRFKNCKFHDNLAAEGGAIYIIDQPSPVFEECIFENNQGKDPLTSGNGQGGVLVSEFSFNVATTATIFQHVVFTNCLLSKNNAYYVGGFVINGASQIGMPFNTIFDFNNCTFSDNYAAIHGLAAVNGVSTNFNNCILWANQANNVKMLWSTG